MANTTVFGANFSKSKSISVTSTTGSATLDATDVASTPSVGSATPAFVGGTSGGHSVIRLVNDGAKTCYVRWGVGAQTALTTDMALFAGATEYVAKGADVDTVAAITAGADTTTLRITCGEML